MFGLLRKWQKCTDIFIVRKEFQLAFVDTARAISSPVTNSELEQAHIAEAIRIAPKLATVKPELWHQMHKTFTNHGIITTSFLRIATGNPTIFSRAPQKIVESIELWRNCQFGEKNLHLLLTKYPELIDVTDGRKLLVHITFMKEFVGTSKNVWKLLMNCPNLMEQTRERIEKKFKYMTEVMRIDVPEIIKSEALSQSLQAISCRHVFLVRLGLFKPRPPKLDETVRTSNNRLYQITDTSEKTFATKICHVSLDEFEAFKELFARESKRRQDVDNQDDAEHTDEP